MHGPNRPSRALAAVRARAEAEAKAAAKIAKAKAKAKVAKAKAAAEEATAKANAAAKIAKTEEAKAAAEEAKAKALVKAERSQQVAVAEVAPAGDAPLPLAPAGPPALASPPSQQEKERCWRLGYIWAKKSFGPTEIWPDPAGERLWAGWGTEGLLKFRAAEAGSR